MTEIEGFDKKKVFSASYSGVKVYEMVVGDGGLSVMRRAQDDFLNATQILKIAGFAKSHRLRILEQDVIPGGMHERVQGGNGKYQGTWVPWEAGKILAERYGVGPVIAQLLNYNPATDEKLEEKPTKSPTGNNTSKKNDMASITKRTPIRSRAPSSSTAMSSPPERHGVVESFISSPSPTRSNTSHHQEPTPTYNPSSYQQQPEYNHNEETIYKRLFDEESAQQQFLACIHVKRIKLSKNEDFAAANIENYTFAPLPTSSLPKWTPEAKKQELLMHIYVKQDNGLNNAYFFEILRSGENSFDVDIILDDRNSTPLHWASFCGRLNLVSLLIFRGATPLKLDKNGQTALMRSLQSSYLYSQRSMDNLLTLLGSSLFAIDNKRQSALHQTVLLSKYRSKRAMSNYYMECISNFIEDTRESIQQSYTMFLDASDKNGDTALHMACRYKNHRIVYLLLSLGASTMMQNLKGETPFTMAAGDPRLLKLLECLPDPEFNDYLDAPTSDLSDEDEEDQINHTSVPKSNQLVQLAHFPSSSTLSSVGGSFTPIEAQVITTAAQLNSSRMYISELKSQKEKFEDMSKYASKLQAVLERPSTPQPIIGGVGASSSLGAGAGVDEGKRKVSSQRTLMTETKLSSRLIRLESLVKASTEEQLEILRRIELIKEERGLKDVRYARLIAQACKLGEGGENQVDDLLEKIEETM